MMFQISCFEKKVNILIAMLLTSAKWNCSHFSRNVRNDCKVEGIRNEIVFVIQGTIYDQIFHISKDIFWNIYKLNCIFIYSITNVFHSKVFIPLNIISYFNISNIRLFIMKTHGKIDFVELQVTHVSHLSQHIKSG